MDIVYRKLQAEDAGSYRSVRLESLKRFPENFGSSYEEESATPKLEFQTLIEESSGDGFVLGAFCDDRLIGIAGFRRAERRKTRHRGEIVQMYVNPDYWGQRIGENLLRMTIGRAFKIEGIEQLELAVVSGNLSATKLYERIGFEVHGVEKNYFKDGERYWHQQFMQLFKGRYLEERATRERDEIHTDIECPQLGRE